jgi:ribonuclease HI
MLKYAARLSIHPKTHPTLLAINKCNIPFRKQLKQKLPMGKLVHQLNSILPINLFTNEPSIVYEHEPWNNVQIKVNTSLTEKGNKLNQEHQLKIEALEIINIKYHQYTKIFTDGSKITKPYKTAAAMVIPERKVQLGRRLPDYCSIYTAEFWAILEALKWIEENKPNKTVIISDSLSVLSSIQTNTTRTRENFLNQINAKIKQLNNSNIIVEFMWIPSHIEIRGNEMADQLAKAKLNEPNFEPLQYSPSELYSIINNQMDKLWQNDWDSSTKGRVLYTVAREINRNKKSPKGSPLEQTIINRITIGKTKLANSIGKYLGPRPHNINCYNCNIPEDLQHIFNNCLATKKERGEFKFKQISIGAPYTYPEIVLDNNPNILETHKNMLGYLKNINKIENI